jgi:alkanesulfonate monooxygenase SsuD/methylene tetrahydromethanopterin reductase-like flavin-dependent oxidoreductase (luciferase family)
LNPEKLAFALRPGIFSPQEIVEISRRLERSSKINNIFIPDGRTGYESLEVVSSILSATETVRAGSGVIRLLEHDPTLLIRRTQTLQAVSSNRFILGVGTGTPGPQPGKSVTATLRRIDELKKSFQAFPQGVAPPEIYVAALKSRIAERAASKVDGLLLNFCTPHHASRIIERARPHNSKVEFACYLKLFFSSQSKEVAERLLIQEFVNYDSTPQYHEMFQQDGTAEEISSLRTSDEWKKGSVDLPKALLNVSLANPDQEELDHYVKSFRKAGITLPVPYPYFPNNEKPQFKRKSVELVVGSM